MSFESLKAALSALRARASVWKQIRALRHTVSAYRPAVSPSNALRRLVIVPSDPWTLVGAKGDEAMMQAVIGRLRDHAPALQVAVVTATPEAEAAARSLGFVPLPAWSCPMAEAIQQLEAFAPDAMVVLGADVMDGYYSPVTTTRMLMTAEAAARFGTRVSILGFSFNSAPNPRVRVVFDSLSPSMSINLRDRISLARFQRFSNAATQLVADSAFMLKPDHSTGAVAAIEAWAVGRRAAGELVLGFNLHPMLIRAATPLQVAALVDSAVEALRRLCGLKPVSLLFLSHDYRGGDGDDVCLAPIALALATELGSRLAYPTTRFSAAQLKAMAGVADGVVTGRMHLAIATLGMGRPVAALTYQDKFQGLFAHFDYPERFLLTPAAAVDAAQLTALMVDFVDQLPALKARVDEHLPAVQAASALNLRGLIPAAAGQPSAVGSAGRMAA